MYVRYETTLHIRLGSTHNDFGQKYVQDPVVETKFLQHGQPIQASILIKTYTEPSTPTELVTADEVKLSFKTKESLSSLIKELLALRATWDMDDDMKRLR